MLPYIIQLADTALKIVISISKIAQNYWHSLHLNVKDSNFKFLPTFLILDLSVSCVSWTGPNRYKMQNTPTQTILYSLSQIWARPLRVCGWGWSQQKSQSETLDPIYCYHAQANRKLLKHNHQFHHSASYQLIGDPRIYINIEHFR